jgi:hypothetical protein
MTMTDTGDKVMNAVSYGGAGVSFASGLTLTDWGVVVGITTALVTFALNYAYQRRKERREARLCSLQEELLRRQCEQIAVQVHP